jgi:O-antigen/teichoic acid export membrane protein
MSQIKLVKNAFANICRIGIGAFVALALPPFLTKILSKDAYGTWLLILQLSTYVSFLEFGIQTAVGRYVAHHNELGEFKQRDSIVSTALVILTGSGLLAICGISTLAWKLPDLFQSMPTELHQDAQLALFYVGTSLAVALPFSVFGGIFIGVQRYDVPAWITGISRLLGGVFIVLIAHVSHSIVMMAVVMAVTNVGSGLWQFLAYRRVASDIRISKQGISKVTGLEITTYCLTLTITTIGMLLVSGMDTVIVGYFDYKSVVYYSLAASLTTFLIGIHTAIFGAMMPKAAEIGANQDRDALGNLLVTSTRYGAIILIVTSLPLVIGANWFLTLWLGASYADQTTLLLQLMVIANCIRYLGSPYSTIAMAIGAQKQTIVASLSEGLINIVISIILTAQYGLIGVIGGTLCGAFVSVGLHYTYSLPRTEQIRIKEKKMLIQAVARPLISVTPVFFLWAVYQQFNLAPVWDFSFLVGAIGISYLLLWNYATSNSERAQIKDFFNAKFSSLKKTRS